MLTDDVKKELQIAAGLTEYSPGELEEIFRITKSDLKTAKVIVAYASTMGVPLLAAYNTYKIFHEMINFKMNPVEIQQEIKETDKTVEITITIR